MISPIIVRIISLSDFDNVNNSDNFDEFFENIGYRFDESLGNGWDRIAQSVRDIYNRTTEKLEDEISLPIAQTYVNDALQSFVTDNVKAILELRVDQTQSAGRCDQAVHGSS